MYILKISVEHHSKYKFTQQETSAALTYKADIVAIITWDFVEARHAPHEQRLSQV